MKDCYYVLARIVAKSSSGQAVDEVMVWYSLMS